MNQLFYFFAGNHAAIAKYFCKCAEFGDLLEFFYSG